MNYTLGVQLHYIDMPPFHNSELLSNVAVEGEEPEEECEDEDTPSLSLASTSTAYSLIETAHPVFSRVKRLWHSTLESHREVQYRGDRGEWVGSVSGLVPPPNIGGTGVSGLVLPPNIGGTGVSGLVPGTGVSGLVPPPNLSTSHLVLFKMAL